MYRGLDYLQFKDGRKNRTEMMLQDSDRTQHTLINNMHQYQLLLNQSLQLELII